MGEADRVGIQRMDYYIEPCSISSSVEGLAVCLSTDGVGIEMVGSFSRPVMYGEGSRRYLL